MTRSREIGVSLTTPSMVQTLQTTLHAKAKAEPSYRFYSLWDKVCRADVLREAWQRCRRNGGAAGSDRVSFKDIESAGMEQWLGRLQHELRLKQYEPGPLLRVWIPKSNGGRRGLGIPTVRDRVVQAAVVVVLTPIFEADLRPEQYGFRPRLDAKTALRQVHQHLTLHGRTHVVDADLTDYFNTIPHGALMKCVARRVADGTLLSTIKAWLEAAVVEREGNRERRSTEARDRSRGTPQGGVVSPLLANLYFRRFVLAWQRSREAQMCRGAIVNYADDLVICCAPGTGGVAMNKVRELMQRLGLSVNDKKTRLVDASTEQFDFLGYTVGQFYGRHGKQFLGTAPSKKSIKRVRKAIHDETSSRWNTTTVEERVRWINQILRGWCGYFNQGPVQTTYTLLSSYTERRLRRWLMRKHKRRGTGYRQYSDEMLYEQLGLYKPVAPGRRQLSAKA